MLGHLFMVFEIACKLFALPQSQMLYLLMSESCVGKHKFVIRGDTQLVIATQWANLCMFQDMFAHEIQQAGMNFTLDPLLSYENMISTLSV